MYGNRERGELAQLALLDAVMFFTVSAVICGSVASHVASELGDDHGADAWQPQAREMLAVFLDASVGRAFPLAALGVEVTGYETFADVLLAVSDAVLGGEPADSFQEVLSYCALVLDALCEPWDACLRLSSGYDGTWAPITETGEPPADGEDSYACSQVLGSPAGTEFQVTLLLSGPLLIHDLHV